MQYLLPVNCACTWVLHVYQATYTAQNSCVLHHCGQKNTLYITRLACDTYVMALIYLSPFSVQSRTLFTYKVTNEIIVLTPVRICAQLPEINNVQRCKRRYYCE